ncbi:MAG TPA: ABC transporter permease [Candidatus Dorea stercoravium]|nr:ABC transporter permease [Candidatus Dorea stercoravium]
MWKEYSKGYLKQNRSAGVSVMAAALLAAFFLSLLCSLFYNFWAYDVERILLEEGDWHVRIEGSFDREDLELIRGFSGVDRAEINEGLSEDKTVVELRFEDMGDVYKETALICGKLGIDMADVSWHETLLSRYFITDPQDSEPPLLLPFFAAVLLVLCVSLVLVIRTAFEISMQARVRQFGIFSSIGATPGQIRLCLVQEAAALCALPVLAGILLGTAGCAGILEAVNRFAADVPGRHEAVFQYHPAVLLVTAISAVLTVLCSAWAPARKLSRMTPLQALREPTGLQLKKKSRQRILGSLIGIEGELAGNALKMQKKALRISNLSLALSFLGFTAMLCFFTLSGISTRYTYFERYQDAWDVMVTVKDTDLADFSLSEQVRKIPGVRGSISYQKADGTVLPGEDWFSDRLVEAGGYEALAGTEGTGQIPSQVVVMDDASFLEYCQQIGAEPGVWGTVVLNRIWDSTSSSFRERAYIPFANEEKETLAMGGEDGATLDIPVLSYTEEAPLLREEYEDYALVQFMPLSLWETLPGQALDKDRDTFIRILGPEGADLQALDEIEKQVTELLTPSLEVESENRIQERLTNGQMLRGAQMIGGSFCVLLGVIGLAGIFSNTFGFLRQRKREFARYLAVGMDSGEMRKIFCIEAAVIAGRPILLGLGITVPVTVFMTSASHLELSVFLEEAPFVPVSVYGACIVLAVALAYWLGMRRLAGSDLSGCLRDDALN